MPASDVENPVSGARPLVGTVLTLPGAVLAELLAEPFDFVWIDLEHGSLGRGEAVDVMIGAQAVCSRVMVRVPACARSLVAPMLDAGAGGIVLPDADCSETATEIAALMAYPPAGRRGFGPRRSSLRGRTLRVSRAEPELWVQIESEEGVSRVDEIASVRGVSAIVAGTADLSFALGTPRQAGSSVVSRAVRSVREAAGNAGVMFGVAGPLNDLPEETLEGASFLLHSTDARICAQAVDDTAAWLRTLRTS